jgi:hypothetical protein
MFFPRMFLSRQFLSIMILHRNKTGWKRGVVNKVTLSKVKRSVVKKVSCSMSRKGRGQKVIII